MPMRTKAAVVEEPAGPFDIVELEIGPLRAHEVLVRIVGVGICHTDVAARDQHIPMPLPAVLGHEGAGVVEEVGSAVSRVRPGDTVVLTWTCCGTCDACRAGQYTYCEHFFRYNLANGSRPDGSATLHRDGEVVHGHFFAQSSFAHHALAPEGSVVPVHVDMPAESLAPLGCGVVTGAGTVMNDLRPRPGDSLAVFGTGTVGFSAILAAVVCGCTTIIAVARRAERLAVAQRFGATHTVNVTEVDPVEAIRDITAGGVDFSLECVGEPAVLRQSVDVLRRRGVCALLGAVAPGTPVTLDMDLLMNGRSVRGIIEGNAVPDLFIPRLLELHAQGRFPYTEFIRTYDFDDINEAVDDMEHGRVIKPVLRP
jgi:aryl-alcohol dehydrogenase